MISTRYAVAVVTLVGLAGIPTVMHSYMDTAVSDGRRASAIPLKLGQYTGTPVTHRSGWGEDRFATTDWIERKYGSGPEVTLFVGRSLDAKLLYHHPELAVSYGHNYGPAALVELRQFPGVPVHLLRDADSRRVALYTLRYGGNYVANPVLFQLRTSLELLVSRRKAMTLFFATEELRTAEEGIESSRAAAVLLAAMRAFDEQQGSAPRTIPIAR